LRKQVEDKRTKTQGKVEGVDPDVWERLPFWVRELLKMLRK